MGIDAIRRYLELVVEGRTARESARDVMPPGGESRVKRQGGAQDPRTLDASAKLFRCRVRTGVARADTLPLGPSFSVLSEI